MNEECAKTQFQHHKQPLRHIIIQLLLGGSQ